ESGSVDILPSGGDVPVGFSASVISPATRAELTTSNLTSMGVFASYTGQSNWNAATSPNFMYNQRVTRTGSTSPWTYSPMKYWPNTAGDKISFFAYAPHNADVPGLSINTGAGVAGYPKLYYDLPVSATSQKDLLVAVPLKDKTKGTASLAFTMKHALTRVLVNVKCVDAITVTKVELSSMSAGFGTLTWNSDGTPAWSFTSSMSSNYSTSTSVPANAANPTQVAEFFLFPVGTPSNKLTITYSLNGSSETKEVAIPNTPAWTMGQAIAYTLKIDTGSEITLSVKAWDTNTTSGTVGEDVPTTGYPFLKNGIIYDNATKFFYVGNVQTSFPSGDGNGWYNLNEAVDICKRLYSLGQYPAYEWRLPNISELTSAVQLKDINTGQYIAGTGSTFWANTPYYANGHYYVMSNRGGGIKSADPSTYSCRILCIRDMGEITPPTIRHYDTYNILYQDASTTLMVTSIQKGQYSGWVTYADAVSYCNNGNWGGYTDWRLPTRTEARMMMNWGKWVLLFSAVWSSTVGGTGQHYTINENGQDNPQNDAGDNGHTFCVR
ncbi:fimbrillin family protein, partial [Bacteroides sp.]